MLERPQTKAEAHDTRYGAWSGNPNGQAFNESRCAESVWPAHGWIPYQCKRKPGHGPDGLYCKQHAKRFEGKSA